MYFAVNMIISPLIQFEYQQAQLEREIENLSWKVERAEATTVAVSSSIVVHYAESLLMIGFEATNEHY